ncbi:MAG: hypothetical protein CL677_08185 [Bdellovibrionaceae bacterium]|nr:hypothetical protein [Pseudobdellovibrionaceae bacterium]|tara:strand:+ start:63123 stop:63992 length:870 start_codon:yes stop_codon:yes gene_type:complete
MDYNLLKIFVKVADCGSLTKASKVLNHPKSKISRDLVKLENELEQTLLIRTPRGITLTEQGFSLLQSTRSQLDALESSLQKLKSDPNNIKGNIKITAPEDLSQFILTRLITEFMDIYPDVTIELYSTSEFLDFRKNNIDLALRIGKLKDSSLIQKKIIDVDVIFVASKMYIKASGEISTLEDLRSHSVASIKDIDGSSFSKTLLKDQKLKFSSNSMSVLKDFVELDKGVATLPYFLCKKEIATHQFLHILPKHNYLSRSLFLLSPPSSFSPKHVKLFKKFLSERIPLEL